MTEHVVPLCIKPTDKFPDLWKRMAIQRLMLKTEYAEIQYDIQCPTIQKDIPKQIYKDCGTLFPESCCRKGNRWLSLVDAVDVNVSENEKEGKMQNSNEKKKKQPNASNTAQILNIFEILVEMPFIDAIDDDGQIKSTKQSKTKFHHHHSSVKGPHRQFVSWRILFLFLCYKCKILFTIKYKINQCNKSVQHCVSFRT